MPFVLFANVNFVPGRYDDWQAAYDKLGAYVWEKEPTTLTYYFGVPLQYWTHKSDTTHMFAFEVYGERHDLYTTHFSSPAMQDFLAAIPETMTTGLDLKHYEDVGGFLDRFGDKRECELMTDVRITCHENSRDKVLSKLVTLVNAMKDSGSAEVYTLLVLKSLDDNTGVRFYQRFKSWQASTTFARNELVLDFWMTSKEDIASMESQSYIPNGKGWLHRED
ncbi:hypothetical protein LTS17_009367 [Exophiala oligosperma]